MNNDEFEGQWKLVRGHAREWWGKLTDDDVEQVAGNFENFISLLQEKYGYTRERAETEYHGQVAEYDAHQKKMAASIM